MKHELTKDFTYPAGPQAMTIFIPIFGENKIKLRTELLTDDWIADCQKWDKKYGMWFATHQGAIDLIGDFYTLEV